MLKNFFRSVRKVAKNIAPIAAPIAGFYFGAPVGAGIGALLGQYGGRDAALRAAALGGIGGLAGPKGMDIFGKGGLFSGGSTKASPQFMKASQSGNIEALRQTIRSEPVKRRLFNPLTFAGIGSTLLAALNKEEDSGINLPPIPKPGSQGQLGDLDTTPIEYLGNEDSFFTPNKMFTTAQAYADGGIVALKKGGTVDDYGGIGAFDRKNGEIAGPGTMTSDDIPAMLSDGEFVTKAISVLGAGVKHGGAKTKEEARKKGAEFFYKKQKELEPFGKKVV